MKNFKKLQVWEKGMAIVVKTYEITKTIHREEQYGLISQMRRSAQSIPTNIAEGCGRNSEKDFLRFWELSFLFLGTPTPWNATHP